MNGISIGVITIILLVMVYMVTVYIKDIIKEGTESSFKETYNEYDTEVQGLYLGHHNLEERIYRTIEGVNGIREDKGLDIEVAYARYGYTYNDTDYTVDIRDKYKGLSGDLTLHINSKRPEEAVSMVTELARRSMRVKKALLTIVVVIAVCLFMVYNVYTF